MYLILSDYSTVESHLHSATQYLNVFGPDSPISRPSHCPVFVCQNDGGRPGNKARDGRMFK